MGASAVLRVLARLSSSGRPVRADTVIDLSASSVGAIWLGEDRMWSVQHGPDSAACVLPNGDIPTVLPLRRQEGLHRLAAIDQLHHEARVLRAGWTVLTGPATIDGKQARLCTPLVCWPVRLTETGDMFDLEFVGDPQTTPLVANRITADRLAEQAPPFAAAMSTEYAVWELEARTERWIRHVCAAAGLQPRPAVPRRTIRGRVRWQPSCAAAANGSEAATRSDAGSSISWSATRRKRSRLRLVPTRRDPPSTWRGGGRWPRRVGRCTTRTQRGSVMTRPGRLSPCSASWIDLPSWVRGPCLVSDLCSRTARSLSPPNDRLRP